VREHEAAEVLPPAAPAPPPKVVVVGHVTRDLIRIPGRPDRILPGGSALYASVALQRLGCSVTVVTKLAAIDAPLLEPMRLAGIEVVLRPSAATTVFENSYAGAQLAARAQRVPSIAAPFLEADLRGLAADAVHLGPLTAGEMGPPLFGAARAVAPWVSFDAQGVLRRVVEQMVVDTAVPVLRDLLRHVDVLKVDDAEAAALVGEDDPVRASEALAALGPREVLVTFADRGSLIRTPDGVARIDAIPPRAIADATGCGDTYLAGCLAARLRGEAPARAARIGAAAASLKLEAYGPLRDDWAAVLARTA
jgi:sugar/nucleoside kinase (ribokinase family)